MPRLDILIGNKGLHLFNKMSMRIAQYTRTKVENIPCSVSQVNPQSPHCVQGHARLPDVVPGEGSENTRKSNTKPRGEADRGHDWRYRLRRCAFFFLHNVSGKN